MITLHRLGRAEDPFQLNPDLIVTVEATPDTVVTLATDTKVLVSETPEQVTACTREWHAEVLKAAMHSPHAEHTMAPLKRLTMHAHAG
jgi:uncharacterized protein YlzI (FlbEa/FlbD family)